VTVGPHPTNGERESLRVLVAHPRSCAQRRQPGSCCVHSISSASRPLQENNGGWETEAREGRGPPGKGWGHSVPHTISLPLAH
jgi:hypothetical protein